jgi:hypothetical protein
MRGGDDSPQRGFARLPSLRLAPHRGAKSYFYFLNSLCGASRREGGRAQRRPGESWPAFKTVVLVLQITSPVIVKSDMQRRKSRGGDDSPRRGSARLPLSPAAPHRGAKKFFLFPQPSLRRKPERGWPSAASAG